MGGDRKDYLVENIVTTLGLGKAQMCRDAGSQQDPKTRGQQGVLGPLQEGRGPSDS